MYRLAVKQVHRWFTGFSLILLVNLSRSQQFKGNKSFKFFFVGALYKFFKAEVLTVKHVHRCTAEEYRNPTMNHIQGWMTVMGCYSRSRQIGRLVSHVGGHNAAPFFLPQFCFPAFPSFALLFKPRSKFVSRTQFGRLRDKPETSLSVAHGVIQRW